LYGKIEVETECLPLIAVAGCDADQVALHGVKASYTATVCTATVHSAQRDSAQRDSAQRDSGRQRPHCLLILFGKSAVADFDTL